ncbi:MlaD family protein [Rhodococcus qingshengii]|uniref:MlaD family protein n=1 Tax=Rhodococcus qingshengii TaxID=334542 RepID=UPI003647BCF7
MFNNISGRGPTALALLFRGLIAMVALILLTTVLWARYSGDLTKSVDVVTRLYSLGSGLQPSADVKFRGVIVGKVGEVTRNEGSNEVELLLDPSSAARIPKTAVARAVPSNIFGVTVVELVGTGDLGLSSGSVLEPDESTEALELQTAMTSLQKILRAIDPRQLGDVLAVLSEVLEGRGTDLRDMSVRMSEYIKTIGSEIPDLSSDVDIFTDAMRTVEATGPQLIDALHASLPTLRTIEQNGDQISRLLATAGGALNATTGALEPNMRGGIELINNLDTTVSALASTGNSIVPAIETIDLFGTNLQDSFGSPSGLIVLDADIALTPFTPYTSRDCPRYQDMSGPNCAPADRDADHALSSFRGGNLGGVGSGAEREIISELFGHEVSAVESLLVGPVLRSNRFATENGPVR